MPSNLPEESCGPIREKPVGLYQLVGESPGTKEHATQVSHLANSVPERTDCGIDYRYILPRFLYFQLRQNLEIEKMF